MSAVDAVVVAAGGSTRMAGVDKTWAPVAGRPLLAWTLDALAAAPPVRRIVVVVAASGVPAVRDAWWRPSKVEAIVPGGPRRQDSVAAGVSALGESDPGSVVLVHDGARPLVSVALVERVVAATVAHGAAIPVLPVAETLKRIEGDRVAATVDRTSLAAAQTPQGIRRDILARAWALHPPGARATWTDEAALLEACRIPVHAVHGESENLKVTLPGDLARVEAALVAGGATEPMDSALRVGFGHDGHAFGPGGPLALGGLLIEGAPRLHGHSDGDVGLHAVCDALLGAAGLGDLGRVFPAGPSTPAGIASRDLLTACVAHVAAAGYAAVSIDVTLVGARPRLAARLESMAVEISSLVGIPVDRVNVKASTGNLVGFEGAGRGISARAVVLVAPAARTAGVA